MPHYFIYQSRETGEITASVRGVDKRPCPAANEVYGLIESDKKEHALEIFVMTGQLTRMKEKILATERFFEHAPYVDHNVMDIMQRQHALFQKGMRKIEDKVFGLTNN